MNAAITALFRERGRTTVDLARWRANLETYKPKPGDIFHANLTGLIAENEREIAEIDAALEVLRGSP